MRADEVVNDRAMTDERLERNPFIACGQIRDQGE
jgi:hypothetical protein